MNRELKMRLEAGLDEIAPKFADRILEQEIRPIASEAELFGEPSEARAIRQMPPGRRKAARRFCGAVAGLAAMFVFLVCFREVQESNIIEGQIIVDVNPSVALSVNKMGRVRNVEALNADGISIVDGLSKRKGTIETVLESVFTSLETQDYLKSEKAGVLVSYCYERESAVVETKIQSAIVSLSGSRSNCTIYSQTFARENDEEEKAKTAGVSVGKYYFVNRIKEEPGVSEEVSYDKTLEEIVQIMDDQGVQVAGVEVYTGGSVPMLCADTEGTGTEDGNVLTTEMEGDSSGKAPESEMPGTEEAGSEDSGSEHPVVELPDNEHPGSETPGTEEPETEHPDTEKQPESEEPGTEEPGSREPETEHPDTEKQPEGEEPGTEEPEVDVSGLIIERVLAECGEDGKVHVVWDAPEKVSGYEIYYRNTGRKDYEKIAENVTGTSCAISGLIPGRSYLFRIVPYLVVDGEKYFGEGQTSEVVEIVPPHREPEPEEEAGESTETESEPETGESTGAESEPETGESTGAEGEDAPAGLDTAEGKTESEEPTESENESAGGTETQEEFGMTEDGTEQETDSGSTADT